MDSNKRLVLTIVLTFVVFSAYQFVYQTYFAPPPEEVAEAPEVEVGAGGSAPGPAVQEAPAAAAPAPAPAADLPERRAQLRTDEMVLTFSSHGGGLVGAELLGRKGRRQGGDDAPPVDLAAELQPGDPLLFETALGGALPPAPPRAPCELSDSDDRSVTFRCPRGDLLLEKKFSLTGDQTLSLETTLRNGGDAPVEGSLVLLTPARVDPSRQQSGGGCGGLLSAPPQPTQAICRHGEDDVTRRLYDADEPETSPSGAVTFAGLEERYFLAVAVPTRTPAESSCRLLTPAQDFLATELITPTGAIPPGGTASISYALVLGTKDLQVLEGMSEQIAAETGRPDPQLGETVDLGFWAAIARMLLALMKLFHALIPNWGVAIILLTIFVKIVTFPLAWKSMKSMEEMRKLAPELEKLKAKYGDDREKLNLEMMRLYQQHKVNPLGGCLPMLIQMPIWLALYTTLQTSVELYNEPFIAGWIDDLTSKDPFYLLPLAMGATMFATQKMQPMQMDATQQKMMLYFMPIFFTFIMLNLPAGLTLYIFTNNVLSIVQQLALRKSMGLPMVGAPATGAAGSTNVRQIEKKK